MENHNRYVAHIDVLGMSDLVKKSPDLAWELLSQLVDVKKHAHDIQLTFIDTNETIIAPDIVRAVTFSDTILLFSKSNTPNDLRTIMVIATEMLNKALSKCIPIRAGVSIGLFYFNLTESMYAGPALIEAYEIGEAAQWIGIVATEEVYKNAKRVGLQAGSKDLIVPARIPLKDGFHDGYAIDWPSVNPNNIRTEERLSGSMIYAGFDQYFGAYDSLHEVVRRKYENTASFINKSLNR